MNKKGFTLAEVLITLVIIGVIAAMTVPTLMNNTQGQEYKAAYKKAISTLNQALARHYAFTGEGLRAAGAPLTSEEDVINPFLNNVTGVNIEDPFPWDATDIDGEDLDDAGVLPDGTSLNFDLSNWDVDENNIGACNTDNTVPCAKNPSIPNVFIDVNGQKGPNKMTLSANHPKDQYQAIMYNTKVLPVGNAAQQIMYEKERK
ncbi:type II secretion system protein [bacterium]|nr:type II secretion system protein [bacterium]